MFWRKHRRISNATNVRNSIITSNNTRIHSNENLWIRDNRIPRTAGPIQLTSIVYHFFMYFVPLLITLRLLFIGFSAVLYNDNNNSIENYDILDTEHISTCTFDDLFTSFGNRTMLQQQINNCQRVMLQPNVCCWNLHEIIIRVPVASIKNRNSLQKLGGGRKGGVYKAIIQLKQHHHNQTTKFCTVAVKTDYCTTKSFIETSGDYIYRRWIKTERVDPTMLTNNNVGSCLQPHARLADWKSFLGSEYTGALIYYSQIIQRIFLQQQTDSIRNNNNHTSSLSNYTNIAGLLPTYGVITADYPLTSVYPMSRYFWQGSPLRSTTNGNVIGVILPIQQQFESLVFYNKKPWNISRAKQLPHCIYELNSNIQQLIQTVLLPTAIGLHYVNANLGLAYQDVKEKNIGIIYDINNKTIPRNAFLYDHSYIGVADRTSPAWNKECYDVSCRYCMEPNDFPIANRKKDLFSPEYDNLQSEFFNYRRVVLEILEVCPKDQHDECMRLHNGISNRTSIRQFLQTIQEYNVKNDGNY